MPVILLTNSYSEKVQAVVRKEVPEGFEFITLDRPDKNSLLMKAGRADYFLASGRVSIDKVVIDRASNLRMIQRTGVGTDTMDLEFLKEKGIPVYINRGVNSVSVAEHTILLILSVLRKLPLLNSSIKSGIWLKNDFGVEGRNLNGKTVGIVGLGSIGRMVARMLLPFEVRILYFDPLRADEEEESNLNINYENLTALLKEADILSLHCPLTSQTRGLIGESELALMKRGAIVINTGRGPLIDESALISALRSGHISGAGLDVFTVEPPHKDNPLFSFDNVVVSPHIGGLTFESFSSMMKNAFENIRLFEEGQLGSIESKRII